MLIVINRGQCVMAALLNYCIFFFFKDRFGILTKDPRGQSYTFLYVVLVAGEDVLIFSLKHLLT